MKKVYCMCTAILLIYMENKKSSACLNEQVESLPNIPIRLPSESSNYWSGGSDPVLSDDGLQQQWYRVVHDGYQYLMVDSNNKPDHQYCSTYYPVYLQGTHPSVESLTETAQSFVACQRNYFYPCSVSYAIKIRRCGTEVQYYLPPTDSYNAFCFRTSHRETWEPGTTNTISSEPGTQPEFSLHHSTSIKNDDTTSGTNLGTTVKQYVEVVDVDNSKFIIILTVCMGMLIVAVIVLVVVIVCRKRKASPKETEENNVSSENKADNDHKYDNPTNIYHTVAERGSVANPYESLRDQNVRELEMSKSEYDVLTPDVNYQTLDYDRMPMKDEHLYQTLP